MKLSEVVAGQDYAWSSSKHNRPWRVTALGVEEHQVSYTPAGSYRTRVKTERGIRIRVVTNAYGGTDTAGTEHVVPARDLRFLWAVQEENMAYEDRMKAYRERCRALAEKVAEHLNKNGVSLNRGPYNGHVDVAGEENLIKLAALLGLEKEKDA